MQQFTNFRQMHFLSPLKLSIPDLKRICIELFELAKAAQQREIKYYQGIRTSPTTATEEQKQETLEQLAREIRDIENSAHLCMTIEGDSGECRTIVFDQDAGSDFDQVRLPRKIKKITFDNAWSYNAVVKKFYFNHIKVELDFSEVEVFNFRTTKTENHCFIEVHGFDETVVLGVLASIVKSFSSHELKGTYFLYRYLRYDILLWSVGLPSILFLLWKSNVGELLFGEFQPGLQPIGYLVVSLFLLLIFKILYNYSKWLFPYLEISEQPKTLQLIQRSLLGVVLAFILQYWASTLFEIFRKLLTDHS